MAPDEAPSEGETSVAPRPEREPCINKRSRKYRHPESVLALAMPTGRFKLEKRTLAIGDLNGKRVAVPIPAGDIVNLIADPSAAGNKMVDVLWEGRTVAMYAVDLKQRGIDTRKA
jgi:hypothetical protein